MRALARSLRSRIIEDTEMRSDRQEVSSEHAKTDDYAAESRRAEECTQVE